MKLKVRFKVVMAYLKIANLKKTYYMSDELSQDVLKGVDANFEKGEMVALLGESGCGKSTLLNILGGLDQEFLGSVVIDGKFMKDFSDTDMDNYRKATVGMIFQSFNLIPHLNILQNVMMPMKMASAGAEERDKRARELLKQVGIEEHYNKLPNQLSGGQRQRVAIARALANDADIILADEPTGNLDKESAQQVIDILTSIAESGKLVIVVTHSETVASKCSRVLVMDNGIIYKSHSNKQIIVKERKPVKSTPKSIETKDLFKLSLSNLIQQKGRTFIVAIGTSVGIAAIIIMFALSIGIKNYINTQVTSNVNLLQINVSKDVSNSGISGNSEYFEESDLAYLKNLNGVERIENSHSINLEAKYTYTTDTAVFSETFLSINGVYPSLLPSMVYPEEYSEVTNSDILISDSLAHKLLNSSADGTVNYSKLIGTKIQVSMLTNTSSRTFNIVGVYEAGSNMSRYATAYIAEDALLTIAPNAKLTDVYLYAKNADVIDSIIESLNYSMYSTLRLDTTVEDLLYYVNLGTMVLMGVSAISLVVSAIMILIVMNISITERTKEIGVIRAIGGRKRDIRAIFLFESGLIGLLSGLIGCAVAGIISAAVNLVMSVSYGANFISGNILIYLLGLAVSVVISMLSGFSPANKAASLDPVESLRRD